MVDSAGFIRTKNMFKYADNADDLAVLAAKSKKNAAVAHLISKHAGDQTVEVLKTASPEFVNVVVRKGRLALRLFKSYHKYKNTIEKTFWQKMPKALIGWFSLICGGIGLVLLLSGILPLYFGIRKKKVKA